MSKGAINYVNSFVFGANNIKIILPIRANYDITEERTSQQGRTYEAVYYNLNAQHFIIDNIDTIIEYNRQKANK